MVFNTSIEAIRSNESGQGFTILAKQIKQLADKNRLYTQEINDLIKEIEEEIQSNTDSSEQAKIMLENSMQFLEEVAKIFSNFIVAVTGIN